MVKEGCALLFVALLLSSPLLSTGAEGPGEANADRKNDVDIVTGYDAFVGSMPYCIALRAHTNLPAGRVCVAVSSLTASFPRMEAIMIYPTNDTLSAARHFHSIRRTCPYHMDKLRLIPHAFRGRPYGPESDSAAQPLPAPEASFRSTVAALRAMLAMQHRGEERPCELISVSDADTIYSSHFGRIVRRSLMANNQAVALSYVDSGTGLITAAPSRNKGPSVWLNPKYGALSTLLMTRRCLERTLAVLPSFNDTHCIGYKICTDYDLTRQIIFACNGVPHPSIGLFAGGESSTPIPSPLKPPPPLCVVGRADPKYSPHQACVFLWSLLQQFPDGSVTIVYPTANNTEAAAHFRTILERCPTDRSRVALFGGDPSAAAQPVEGLVLAATTAAAGAGGQAAAAGGAAGPLPTGEPLHVAGANSPDPLAGPIIGSDPGPDDDEEEAYEIPHVRIIDEDIDPPATQPPARMARRLRVVAAAAVREGSPLRRGDRGGVPRRVLDWREEEAQEAAGVVDEADGSLPDPSSVFLRKGPLGPGAAADASGPDFGYRASNAALLELFESGSPGSGDACEYFLVTNLDNYYSPGLFTNVEVPMVEEVGLIAFGFVTHYNHVLRGRQYMNIPRVPKFERRQVDLGAVVVHRRCLEKRAPNFFEPATDGQKCRYPWSCADGIMFEKLAQQCTKTVVNRVLLFHQSRPSQRQPMPRPPRGTRLAIRSFYDGSHEAAQADQLYQQAVSLARNMKYQEARSAFQECITNNPRLCKAFVSWAQMEKKVAREAGAADRYHQAREVLDRGLRVNPRSSCIIQAWGLLEMQAGRPFQAIRLLDRATGIDRVTITPVLKWKPVVAMRKQVYGSGTVTGPRYRQQLRVKRVVGAAGGEGGQGMVQGTGPTI